MTLTQWLITGTIAWLVAGTLIGILVGRVFRGRNHHPSTNHPAARAHKQLTTDRPLDPYETAAWKLIEEKLRAPDTQESQ